MRKTGRAQSGFLQVRCRRCPNCIDTRKSNLTFRLKEEVNASLHAHFVTLTYSDDNLTINENGVADLNYKDVQLFIRKIRNDAVRKYNWQEKIKYYALGEYGPKNLRPHWHLIFFNLPPDFTESIQKHYKEHYTNTAFNEAWEKGITTIAPVTTGRILYVSGYVQKHLGHKGAYPDNKRRPEFAKWSTGLGKGYLTPAKIDYYRKTLKPYIIDKDGRKLSMAEYYKKVIFDSEELKHQVKRELEDHMEEEWYYIDSHHHVTHVQHRFDMHERKINQKKQTDDKKDILIA